MLDRDKVINWWTGRISDPELAEWTGMAPRAVSIVLNLPHMRAGITGGGRGSRHTRRVDPKTRNAVAIVHALSEAGLTLELATNIIGATPVIASVMTPKIDVSDLRHGLRSLALTEPKGNWLPTDTIPEHIWGRYVYPCAPVDIEKPNYGKIGPVEQQDFKPNTNRGTMVVDRSAYGLPTVELRALTDAPVYAGELDRLGLYSYENWWPEQLPKDDHHLLIVNARWVVLKSPELREDGSVHYDIHPISVIEADRKTVRVTGWGEDDLEHQRANYYFKNHDSLLDINITLAVRKMKRRALGLPVGQPEKPLTWDEQVRIAQRYPAPKVAVFDAEAEMRKMEEEMGVWTTDPQGHRVRAGLTKEESEEFAALDERQWEHRADDDAFPWSSIEEMNRESDRWRELNRKHETARRKRIIGSF